ncbi:MAG TPA: D-glycerate dehydrogenase, partial [Planctomycetes bacterium]|nr:D-glycerate dehydrogenase [Planctomycetota bacterium]
MPKVLITRRILSEAEDVLRAAGVDVVVGCGEHALGRGEFLELLRQGFDGVISMLTDIVNEDAIAAAAPPCRIFANYAVGCNNIDVAAAAKAGVFVTNTPDVLTETTADLAWALIMAAARRIVEADRWLRREASSGVPGWNGWEGWAPTQFLGVDVYGKTLGIAGAGRIGTAVARRAAGFGMRVLYYSLYANERLDVEMGAERVELDVLLERSDFISLHVPLTPETRHMFGPRELEKMKPTSVLVNTSRGAVIDEAALVEALRTG